MHKTENERDADKRKERIEKVALFLVRWSQPMLFIGAALVIIDCLYWTFTAITRWQGAICAAVAVVSIVEMLLGAVVYIQSVMVDERGKRSRDE